MEPLIRPVGDIQVNDRAFYSKVRQPKCYTGRSTLAVVATQGTGCFHVVPARYATPIRINLLPLRNTVGLAYRPPEPNASYGPLFGTSIALVVNKMSSLAATTKQATPMSTIFRSPRYEIRKIVIIGTSVSLSVSPPMSHIHGPYGAYSGGIYCDD